MRWDTIRPLFHPNSIHGFKGLGFRHCCTEAYASPIAPERAHIRFRVFESHFASRYCILRRSTKMLEFLLIKKQRWVEVFDFSSTVCRKFLRIKRCDLINARFSRKERVPKFLPSQPYG